MNLGRETQSVHSRNSEKVKAKSLNLYTLHQFEIDLIYIVRGDYADFYVSLCSID